MKTKVIWEVVIAAVAALLTTVSGIFGSLNLTLGIGLGAIAFAVLAAST